MSNDHAKDTAGPKGDGTTSFTFLNINGVNLRNEAAALRDIFEDQRQMETDLFGLGEINIDTTQFGVKQKCNYTLHKSFEHGKMVMSSSTFKAATEYKPGGTMIVGHDDIVGRMVATGEDRMGRWSWTKLSGSRGKRINFVVVYQVCSRPTNKTGITAYHQQENILRLEHKDDKRHRKHFHKDLISLLKIWQQAGESIILVGDFNKPLVLNISNMAKVAQDLDLVDIYSHRHPHLPEPATYIRGRHRIDYALLSQDLCTSVTACSYEPFHYRTTSDHRQLFLNFDTTKLFGNETERLAAMAFRNIRSKDPKSNTVYLTAKHHHLVRQNFFQLCGQLSTSARDDALAAQLDDICTNGAVHGGK
jgi:exonuclease III